MINKTRVLIIDDSAVMRQFLTKVLSGSKKIEVVGTALDPYIAAGKIKKIKPDVLTLDIEMPRMDGLTFLSKVMVANPMPVIMVSSLTEKGAKSTMKALELGAVDFICKPSLEKNDELENFTSSLIEKVITAGETKVRRKKQVPVTALRVDKKHSADVILAKKAPVVRKTTSSKLIAIGASTGGTEVINEILINLPDSLPGIVITQHMPEKFTKAFADRVNEKSKLFVKEAENGDRIYKGMALIAPGGYHMLVKNDKEGYKVEINSGPPVNRHKPSVDVLFRSVSQVVGVSAVGVICTGMGNDGAEGLLEMKEAGANTVAQDEESSVVYGMPKEAVKLGGVDFEMNIGGIIDYLKKI